MNACTTTCFLESGVEDGALEGRVAVVSVGLVQGLNQEL
jgi:hypothetical protein